MLQEKLARDQGLAERNLGEDALEFSFAVQPSGEHGQGVGLALFPLRNRSLEQGRLIVRRLLDFQIDGEEFLRCFGERMIFERADQIVWRKQSRLVLLVG